MHRVIPEALGKKGRAANGERRMARGCEEMCGVGILFRQDEIVGVNRIFVERIAPGGPADGAGLIKGSLLVTIDDENVYGQDLDYISKYILGPAGSEVRLGFYNRDARDSGCGIEVALKRGIFANPPCPPHPWRSSFCDLRAASAKKEAEKMPMSGMAKHNISSTKEFDEARKAPAELANQIDFLTEEIDNVSDLQAEVESVTERLKAIDNVSNLQAEVESVTERLKAILDGTSEGWLRVLTVFVSPSTSVSKLGPISLSPFHRIRFRDRCDQKEATEITEAKWQLEGQLSEAKSMLSSSREDMD